MTAALQFQAMSNYGPLLIGSATNMTFDANTDAIFFIFQAATTDPITHIGFRYGARVGTPPTMLAALEALSAGAASGTPLGGGSPASATFTPPADTTWDGTWQWITLANSYTPAKGEIIAASIRHSSGTIDASNGLSITRGLANAQSNSCVFPYHVFNTTGAYAKSSLPYTFAYRTASGRYGYPGTAAYTTATAATSGHRQCMYFTLPAGFGSTYIVQGIHWYGKLPAVTGTANYKVGIWDAAGTELVSTGTLDGQDVSAGTTGANRFLFSSSVALNYGTEYYAGVETLAAATCSVNGISLADADDRLAFPLGTSRGLAGWNGSSWTKTDTVVPFVDLIFDDITVPGGGGAFLNTRRSVLIGR